MGLLWRLGWILFIGYVLKKSLWIVPYVARMFCFNFFRQSIPPDDEDDELDEEAITHETYDKEKLKHDKYDALFIGGGSAGLAGASYTVQGGKTAIVLEQSDQLGGMSHTFFDDEIGKYEFDVGLHKMAMDDTFKMLYEKASEDRIQWRCMSKADGDASIIYLKDRQLKDCRGIDRQREYLLGLFPEDAEGINAYCDDCNALFKEFDIAMMLRYYVPRFLRGFLIWLLEVFGVRFFKLNEITHAEYLHQRFPTNAVLRNLCSHWSLSCGLTHQVSGTYPPLVHGLEGNHGGHFPVGGGSQLARKQTRVILKYGGEAYVGARVKRILNEGKKAVGVEMVNGDYIYAETVVACCGFHTTCLLLPRSLTPPGYEEFTEPSIHILQVFIGLSKTMEEMEFPDIDVYMMITDMDDLQGILEDTDEPVGHVWGYVGNCNSVHKVGDGSFSTLNLLIPTNAKYFERWQGTILKQRGPEYEDLKESLIQPFLNELYRLYPLLEENVEILHIGTPLSANHWANYPSGESYGCQVNSKRLYKMYDFIQSVNIKNLIFASADAMPVDGILMATVSGLLASGEILGRDLMMEWKVASMLGKKG